jgi:peroxiredoxin
VGISADSPDRNRAWARDLGLPFRLLSDLDPPGRIGRRYGVWDDLWGLHRRATFLIDREGVVRHVIVDSLALDGQPVLDALARLR